MLYLDSEVLVDLYELVACWALWVVKSNKDIFVSFGFLRLGEGFITLQLLDVGIIVFVGQVLLPASLLLSEGLPVRVVI